MIDRYTKGLLTVIAVSLAVIAIRGEIRPAAASGETACGTTVPCLISLGGAAVPVQIVDTVNVYSMSKPN
ncbi:MULTISPECIES: hypothetical protein [Mesorhizobium]|uniref:Uncharacterized protein n=1 Tax=Mesorhizobium japonicum R7A TaxID=935547 RepID=A0ABX6MMP7_9HYPH|nr:MULTISPECIES: hypothetical protein [Mesorhizobium]ETA72328.1 hypothetical protein MesloDRAFT_1198 [Mesorhizobium japonicum R7A]MBE1709659.1 hypothetical protein [Mesorhizobium japonicum]MBE1714328.1 hypothetical protein [Mesorhizobium japonicum]MUT25309.1 hypothetical protein [Mesorhizobium japonicum]MUT28637.1 hypothetical protein [Mesorhizobium japonicum]